MATILGSGVAVAVGRHLAVHRPRTTASGRVTLHSLSFGPHYDPGNAVFGGLIAHNDDHLQQGAGYPDHPHADVEIVTWVVQGVLAHRDSLGGAADLSPGTVQVQSAGSGIRHSEMADPAAGPTRFVQAWLRPDVAGAAPRRDVTEVHLPGAGLVPLASGSRSAPLRLGSATATLWAARLEAGEEAVLPEDHRQHLFVVSGRLSIPGGRGGPAGAGDAVRITDEPGHRVVATTLTELLVWTFAPDDR